MNATELSEPLAPPLRDIRGPSAWSGDSRRFWRLVWHLARTEFTLKYHGSVLGYLWSLISPLLLFAVLYLAFTEILTFGDDVHQYAATLLFNLTLFQFYSDATARCVTSIVAKEGFVRKMEFPRLAIPVSIVLAATFTLAIDLVVAFVFLFIAGVPAVTTWLLLPVLLIWLLALTIGTSLLLATLFVRYRDTVQAWTVLSRLLFYTSPILFPVELFTGIWKGLLLINPLAPLFTEARAWIVDPSAPTFGEALGGGIYWLYPVAIGIMIIVLGSWLFEREAPRVAEQL